MYFIARECVRVGVHAYPYAYAYMRGAIACMNAVLELRAAYVFPLLATLRSLVLSCYRFNTPHPRLPFHLYLHTAAYTRQLYCDENNAGECDSTCCEPIPQGTCALQGAVCTDALTEPSATVQCQNDANCAVGKCCSDTNLCCAPRMCLACVAHTQFPLTLFLCEI